MKETGAFDRELTLSELLKGIDLERLAASLVQLAGPALRLVDMRGLALFSRGEQWSEKVALAGELEPVGYLEGGERAALAAAAGLLQMILRANNRYLMASELHLAAVNTDYEELQRKHAALQASERRYKELTAQLEQRVAAQVRTIEAAQRQLYQNEKLVAVGQLAAGMAHEINNPMGFINSNLSTAEKYLEKLRQFAATLAAGHSATELSQVWQQLDLDFALGDFGPLLQESIAGVKRVARIVADLKGFSGIEHVADEMTDLNEVVGRAANVAGSRIKERADLVLELGGIPRIRCNAAQLGEVVLNLLLNAADAMESRGRIAVTTDVAEGQLRLRVADTGKGMSPAVADRVFEPFFTTKEVGRGTGLGLTVSNDIIRAHGGTITVESTPGEGSLFTIRLPLGTGH